MPSLEEIKQKRQKKFVKKPYRIWDLDGNLEEKNKPIVFVHEANNTKAYSDIDTTSSSLNALTKTIQQHGQQSGNNQTTFGQQSDNDKTTERRQPDNNQATIRQHLDLRLDNSKTSDQTTERLQITNQEVVTDEIIGLIKNLSGLQEKLFYIILEYCNLNNDVQTGKLKTNKLACLLGCAYRCAKTIIERLTKKNIVRRLKGKSSVAGFVQFEISKEAKLIGNSLQLQKRVSDIEFKNFIIHIRQQVGQQSDNRLDNNENSSSSYIYKTTTTEESQKSNQAATEWQDIDIEPLSQIGFIVTHLNQIASQNKLSPQVVQDSIYAFAFDLQENNKAKSIKGDLINFFMGILRNGKPYLPPSNYESPQDKAMRLYLENKRKIEQGRVEVEKEALTLAFNEWFAKLSDVQKKEFVPEVMRGGIKIGKSKMLESSARNHFEEEIWPEEKEKILQLNKKQ